MPDPVLINSSVADIFDPAVLAMMIPILSIVLAIVAVLAAHQRKMAEIIHSSQRNQNQPGELEAIRQELQSLRTQMNQQTIALDDMRNRQGVSPDISQRIGSS